MSTEIRSFGIFSRLYFSKTLSTDNRKCLKVTRTLTDFPNDLSDSFSYLKIMCFWEFVWSSFVLCTEHWWQPRALRISALGILAHQQTGDSVILKYSWGRKSGCTSVPKIKNKVSDDTQMHILTIEHSVCSYSPNPCPVNCMCENMPGEEAVCTLVCVKCGGLIFLFYTSSYKTCSLWEVILNRR